MFQTKIFLVLLLFFISFVSKGQTSFSENQSKLIQQAGIESVARVRWVPGDSVLIRKNTIDSSVFDHKGLKVMLHHFNEENALSSFEVIKYDNHDSVESVLYINKDNTPRDLKKFVYYYDKNLLAEKKVAGVDGIATERFTFYYGNGTRPLSAVHYNDIGAQDKRILFEYNDNGSIEIISNNSMNGNNLSKTYFTYDSLSRVTDITTENNVDNITAQTIYSYNADGKLSLVRESGFGKNEVNVYRLSWKDNGLICDISRFDEKDKLIEKIIYEYHTFEQ